MQCLQDCFESKDIDLLKKTITELPEEEARYHMKRCIDSGMWVPDASDLEKMEASAESKASTSTSNEEEDIYEDATSSPKKE